MSIRAIGPCPARIMIVGEFPTEQDMKEGMPFSGFSGLELSKMLQEAGVIRSSCFTTTVLKTRPPQGRIEALVAQKKSDITQKHWLQYTKYVLPEVVEALALLRREIELCQPNVIIALGNFALWALTGEWGITSWRGSQMLSKLGGELEYAPKVVPTYSPAMVMRQLSWRPVAVHDFKRAAREAAFRELHSPNYDFIIRPQFSEALAHLHQLYQRVQQAPTKLAVDIETRSGQIACVGIAWSASQAICIPFLCAERLEGYWPEEQEVDITFALYQLLSHRNARIVGQNFLYDAQYHLRYQLFTPNIAWDTMILQHSLFSNMPKGLDFLSSMYCAFHCYWKDEGKEWDETTGEEQLWSYNCKDAVITFEVEEAQQTVVNALGMRAVADFQQSLFFPVLRTMARGLRVDSKQRNEFATTLQHEISLREQFLYDVLGFELNPRSPKQMQQFFYEELNLKPILSRKTGNVTCDDEALRTLAEREPLVKPVVKAITEYRSLGVFFSTFVQAPPDIDGRMRCSFNIAGTDTYRFSSSKNAFGSGMNLQNIPKGGEEDGLDLPNVRNLFIPDPGMTFFDIDLAAADLRIVVWEADEPEMKAMLKEGADPYTEIAKEFYHDPSITKQDPRRQSFKSFAHGTNYLGTAEGLAKRLGLSVHQAEETQKWYFGRFKKIKQWQIDLKDRVLKHRMIQNVFGYRFYFLDRIEGTVFNEAAAWIPQSTVACLINRAYVAIDMQLPEVEILLQVHDSLAGQYPSHLGNDMKRKIVECAEISLPYPDDPLVIPVGVKTSKESWGACG